MKAITILAAGLAILLLAGCGTRVPNDFVKEEKIDYHQYDYIADVVVYKEGYHFLWGIPFSAATPEVAKDIIRDKIKERYPNAAGVYEVQEINRQYVGLFDWRPSITLWGKVVKGK